MYGTFNRVYRVDGWNFHQTDFRNTVVWKYDHAEYLEVLGLKACNSVKLKLKNCQNVSGNIEAFYPFLLLQI